MALSKNKDYYRMRRGQAGYDPTDNGEPQSIFDARAMDFGTESRVTTKKEDKKGVTETEVKTKGNGEKLTLSTFFPTIVPSDEERMAEELANRDILSSNKPRGVVMGDGGYANADNTMTMPVTPFGEKSASGNAMLSDAGIQLVAEDFRNKRKATLAKMQQNRFSEIFDRLEEEKSDDYYEDGSGTGRNYSFFNPKPVQYLNGAKASYEQGPSKEDESIFNKARFMRSLTDGMDDSADVERGMITSQRGTTMDDSADVDLGVAILGSEEMTTVNDDGSVDKDKIEEILSKEQTKKAEDTIITSPAAVKSIQQLEKELKSLKNNPEARKAKYLDFLRENGVLKEWRPDLFKALASTAFRLAMGDSASDAFTYSFGRMQEKKDLAQIAADKAELERIKQTGKGGIKFGKDSKWVNLGTNKNPIKVKMTTREDGVPIVNWQGKIFTFDELKARKIIVSDYHTDAENLTAFKSHASDLTALIKSVGSLDSISGDEVTIEKYMSELTATTQVNGALRALQDQGVDIGPGMDSEWLSVLQSSAQDYLEYKLRENSKDKSYMSFVNDGIVRHKLGDAGITDINELAGYEYVQKWDGEELVDSKDLFELNESAYTQLPINASKFIDKLSKDTTIKGLENVVIERDKIKVAFATYLAWKKENALNKALIGLQVQAATEAGYTPFMYWLREETS